MSTFFFFNDTATTEIYTLSLHHALPISHLGTSPAALAIRRGADRVRAVGVDADRDRKSTRLNSSHLVISYAVFCLKKKDISIICRMSTLTNIPCRRLVPFFEHHVCLVIH